MSEQAFKISLRQSQATQHMGLHNLLHRPVAADHHGGKGGLVGFLVPPLLPQRPRFAFQGGFVMRMNRENPVGQRHHGRPVVHPVFGFKPPSQIVQRGGDLHPGFPVGPPGQRIGISARGANVFVERLIQ